MTNIVRMNEVISNARDLLSIRKVYAFSVQFSIHGESRMDLSSSFVERVVLRDPLFPYRLKSGLVYHKKS